MGFIGSSVRELPKMAKAQLKCSSHLRYKPKTLACEIIIIAKTRSNNKLVGSGEQTLAL